MSEPDRPQDIARERSDWTGFYENWQGRPGDDVIDGFTEGGKRQEEEFRHFFETEVAFDGLRVLEVGFGIGVQARLLRDRFQVASYTGIELSAPPVENIRGVEEFPDNFDFIVCPAEELSQRFPPDSFDIAIIHAVAHHFIDPAACFASIASVSREIVAIEPNSRHPFRRYIERKCNAIPDYPVETSYTLNEWRQFLEVPGKKTGISTKPYRLLPTNALNWRFLTWVPRPILEGLLAIDRYTVRLPILKLFSYYFFFRVRYSESDE